MDPVVWNVPKDDMRIPSSWGEELSLEYYFPPDQLPPQRQPLKSKRRYRFEVLLGLIKGKSRHVVLTAVEACLTLSKEIEPAKRKGNSLADRWQPIKVYQCLILPREQGWAYHRTKMNRIDVRHTKHFEPLAWLFSQSLTGTVIPGNSHDIIGNAFLPSLVWKEGVQLPQLRIIIESPQSDKAFQIMG
ncbi:MAG: hypothetical protein Q8Q10_04605 [bacterium]|nr:hypothetical protein [bacterium]